MTLQKYYEDISNNHAYFVGYYKEFAQYTLCFIDWN